MKKKRILILNPNKSEAMTTMMLHAALKVTNSDTELVGATASRGFEYISSRAEAQIAGQIVLEMIAERIDEIDGVVIAAFGDPGLSAARELFDLPVVGMAEASMLTACTLGQRFCFITFSTRLAPWYEESVKAVGLEQRFTGIHTPDESFNSVSNVKVELRLPLEKIVERIGVQNSQGGCSTDVAILAGAPLAGLATEIEGAPVVLLDPIGAAVNMVGGLVSLAPRGASAGVFSRPPGKANDLDHKKLNGWIAAK